MPKIDVQTLPHVEDRNLPIFAELDAMFREIREQAYRRFEQRGASGPRDLEDWYGAERDLWPATELAEDHERYEVKVALAGFAPEEVELTATPRALIVKASHATRDDRRDERVHWSEFRRSAVCRYIPLPSKIDPDRVKGELKHGLLKATARKAAAAPDKKARSARKGPARKPAKAPANSKSPRAKK